MYVDHYFNTKRYLTPIYLLYYQKLLDSLDKWERFLKSPLYLDGVVGSVLNGDSVHINQLILSIPSTGVTESGVQGMQVHHQILAEIETKHSPSKHLSMYTQYPIIRNGDQR